MNTKRVDAAAGVIHAAMQQGKTLPSSFAYDLEAAQLLQSPETAAELARLRKRVAELEAELEAESGCPGAAIDHDESGICNHPLPDARRDESVAKLRSLLAGQREDTYVSPLHTDYRIGHDLPPRRTP